MPPKSSAKRKASSNLKAKSPTKRNPKNARVPKGNQPAHGTAAPARRTILAPAKNVRFAGASDDVRAGGTASSSRKQSIKRKNVDSMDTDDESEHVNTAVASPSGDAVVEASVGQQDSSYGSEINCVPLDVAQSLYKRYTETMDELLSSSPPDHITFDSLVWPVVDRPIQLSDISKKAILRFLAGPREWWREKRRTELDFEYEVAYAEWILMRTQQERLKWFGMEFYPKVIRRIADPGEREMARQWQRQVEEHMTTIVYELSVDVQCVIPYYANELYRAAYGGI